MNFIFLIGRCIVCHDALSLETATHHLVQRIEEVRDRPIESEFLFRETQRNCSIVFLLKEDKLASTFQLFCTKCCVNIFGANF